MSHGNTLDRVRCGLSIVSMYLLVMGSGIPSFGGQPGPAQLKIIILEGEGAINNIRQRTASEPVVQVLDENDRPVSGAVVTFTLPERGASGLFANGQTSTTVMTDAQGRAVGTGLRPNSVQGEFQIRVSASHNGQTTSATITQVNSVSQAGPSGGVSRKAIALLIAVGGAAAGGILAATQGGNNGTRPPTTGPTRTTVTMEPPTISPPR